MASQHPIPPNSVQSTCGKEAAKKIYPLTNKPPMRFKRSFLVGALDCETLDLYSKEVFVTFCDDKRSVHECFTFKKFLAHIFSDFTEDEMSEEETYDRATLKRRIWYSHNGEFDWVRMIKAFEPYRDIFDIAANLRAHNTLYELVVKEKGTKKIVTRFRDSMALFPRGLADLAQTFSPDTPKGSINFAEGERFDRQNPFHREYARNDALCLMKSMMAYDDFIYEHFEVHLSATAAGTAYQAWLRTLPKGTEVWRVGKNAEEFFRDHCYVGGMVQLNALVGVSYLAVKCYDVNSSYPASMRLGVPKGKPTRTLVEHDSLPGFYRITFSVSDDFVLPVLAHKDPKGLSFPTGQNIEGWATSIEIDYARSLGCLVKVHEGYYFPEGLWYPFNAYVDKCEKLRARFKGQPFETVIKQMQNSLYGRFGMKVDGQEVKVSFGTDPPEGYAMMINTETCDEIPNCWVKTVDRSTEYMLPHYAAWITANSRILLDKGCRSVGADRVLYRDTDSMYLQGDVPTLDIDENRYGAWKHESSWDEFRVHAPKFYSGRKVGQSKITVKAKGMPRKEIAKQEYAVDMFNGVRVDITFPSPNKVLTSMKTGSMGQDRTRHQTMPENIYSHMIVDGFFRPRKIGERWVC
jgi:hypothetical protein